MAVEKINGYELFALCGNGSNETVMFNEFEADLSDGFSHSALFGADTGTKEWNISFNNVQGASASDKIDLDGVLLTHAQYIYDLFCRVKRTGRPFVIQSPLNDQYYLVKFADRTLSFERTLSKLFSTGLRLKQVRVSGVSVFDTAKLSFYGHWNARDISGLSHNDTLTTWADSSGNSRTLTSYSNSNGTIHNKYLTNQQNGLPCVSLSTDTTPDCSLAFATPASLTVKQILMVCKIRGASFSSDAGIVSSNADTDSPALLGTNAGTKFYNLGFSATQDYLYEKNSIEYAESDQQAPMNEFGLVYVKFEDGVILSNLVIGRDREYTDRNAKLDIAELFIMTNPLPDSVIREIIEHLSTVWNLS